MMYFLMKLKYVLPKQLLLFFLIGLTFSSLFVISSETRKKVSDLRIDMIDRDGTEISKKLLAALKAREDIRFGKEADLVFVIKKGFSMSFSKGDLKGLIELKSGELNPYQGLIRDKIAAEVVNQYIYFDLFQRLKEKKNIDLITYEKLLAETKKENELLTLSVEKIGREEEVRSSLRPETYLFLFLLIGAGFVSNAISFLDLSRERELGLRGRLRLSGFSKFRFYSSEYWLSHLRFLFFILGVTLFFRGYQREEVYLSIFLVELSFLLFGAVEETLKKEIYLRFFFPVISLFLYLSGAFFLFFH